LFPQPANWPRPVNPKKVTEPPPTAARRMAAPSLPSATRVKKLACVALVLAGVAGIVDLAPWRQGRAALPADIAPAADVGSRLLAPNPQARILALVRRLEQEPGDRVGRFELAELYFKVGDYDQSLAELRTLERAEPTNPIVPLRQAVVLKAASRPLLAERA